MTLLVYLQCFGHVVQEILGKNCVEKFSFVLNVTVEA